MSSTPEFNGEQLAAARSSRWRQGGDALLTLEASREWVSELGLVLFAPRAHQLPTPAASLVEATLGRAVTAPTAAETETARGLVGRMVAEGAALPLNLLGSAGDVPDFVVSAQVFSYVFTLRGDKNWKQPPTTSGSMKVSLLAEKVYETLAQGNALTARELASELGREVTEAAIVRALGELWAQLRVIPLLQQDGAGAKGSGTMWELTSRRFTKQMKAGANAGQPTALSALISLYLAQVYAATEEETETFLSPLSARSKVRDVLHGLRPARQLESVVLEGKTLLYVPGALPEFPEIAAAEPEKEESMAQAPAAASEAPRERIKRFDGPRPAREERGQRTFRGERERPLRTDRERPAKPFGEKSDRPRREGKSFAGKSFGERERRPFQRDRAQGERKSFTKPWNEERKPRERREGDRSERERPRRDGETRPAREKREFRAGPRSSGPRGGAERGERPQRPFRPRAEGEGSSRPRREGERPFRPRAEGEGSSRPRREGDRPFRPGPRRDGAERGERPQRPFRPRPEGERTSRPRREGERPFRPRPEGERSSRPRREGERPFRSRPDGERPTRPRREGGESAGARPGKPSWPRKERKEGAPEERSQRARAGKPGGKPHFGEKRTFGDKKFGDKKKIAGKPKFGGKPGAKGGLRKDKPKPKPKREVEE